MFNFVLNKRKNMDIKGAIRRLRKERGYTQSELAKRSGISKTTISLIESGKVKPSKESITGICVALQTTESYLMIDSISRSDIPDNKKAVFDMLSPVWGSLKEILKDVPHGR